MNREEIIALLECPKEDAITHFNDDGDDGTFCSDVEDIEAVIAAFRQQQVQESNEPLTLDKLRQMDGKTWLAYRRKPKEVQKRTDGSASRTGRHDAVTE